MTNPHFFRLGCRIPGLVDPKSVHLRERPVSRRGILLVPATPGAGALG